MVNIPLEVQAEIITNFAIDEDSPPSLISPPPPPAQMICPGLRRMPLSRNGDPLHLIVDGPISLLLSKSAGYERMLRPSRYRATWKSERARRQPGHPAICGCQQGCSLTGGGTHRPENDLPWGYRLN
jgi:hypothetical protein